MGVIIRVSLMRGTKYMEDKNMTVYSEKAAWKAADEIFPTDYIYDSVKSKRAGYPVYVSTLEGCYDYICDLGNRLEVNIGAKSVNVWVEEPIATEWQIEDALAVVNDAIYEIDDKVSRKLADAVGITSARDLLYNAYGEIKKILDAHYPESKLYRKYNLNDC
jgi:hypothetical protein